MNGYKEGVSKQGQDNGTRAEELWPRIDEVGSEIDLKPGLLEDEKLGVFLGRAFSSVLFMPNEKNIVRAARAGFCS